MMGAERAERNENDEGQLPCPLQWTGEELSGEECVIIFAMELRLLLLRSNQRSVSSTNPTDESLLLPGDHPVVLRGG